MKRFGVLLLLTSCSLYASTDMSRVNFFGETNYFKQETASLVTSFNMEYRLDIYKPSHKLWVAYVGGKISPDLDVFGKEIKTNVFTTFGVDF